MVEPHKHCPVCGKPIPLDKRTCSPECERILIENHERIKKTRMVMYLALLAFIAVWIYMMLSKH
ncbi:Protein of unknown function DUF2116, Zn-ribbon [Methanothermus fervidus DSM 2088]|uniref:DUF2116 family Zn-ribbon domain-containing protein n=1 Tax=Methanothermus fervidus (strain ATCC 43054 / DSM 2088 / JCM 10308 / V24 S) TaxID=523846 RepID=E3GZH9_METFV|nr:Protein of unknown function DUF2116, Zn-ribbon [Methanothermus fervidus DSM 2088]